MKLYEVTHTIFGIDFHDEAHSFILAKSPEEAERIFNEYAKDKKGYPDLWSDARGVYEVRALNKKLKFFVE